jgi:hypothetical protein
MNEWIETLKVGLLYVILLSLVTISINNVGEPLFRYFVGF